MKIFSIFFLVTFFFSRENFPLLFNNTKFSYHSSFILINCFIGKASKNSLAKNIVGEFGNLSKLSNHLTLFENFSFCNFLRDTLFSKIKNLNLSFTISNLFNVLIKTSMSSPFPAPNSTKLIFSGLFKFSQNDTIQIAIISEKSFEIPGDVIKSPLRPNSIFL